MSAGIYVTGTDTGIGKTHVACALVRAFSKHGIAATGMKPVASGCERTSEGLRNADALDLIAASGVAADYDEVNPYAFADPIAPHLAAADARVTIDLERIRMAHSRLLARSRFIVVEGVGGWLAPLGEQLMQADLVRALRLPAVLVVGMRLGCINHALLSLRAIEADGVRLVGWIANRVDPAMLRSDDNIATLQSLIQAPLLSIVQHGTQSASADDALDAAVQPLLGAASESPH